MFLPFILNSNKFLTPFIFFDNYPSEKGFSSSLLNKAKTSSCSSSSSDNIKSIMGFLVPVLKKTTSNFINQYSIYAIKLQ